MIKDNVMRVTSSEKELLNLLRQREYKIELDMALEAQRRSYLEYLDLAKKHDLTGEGASYQETIKDLARVNALLAVLSILKVDL